MRENKEDADGKEVSLLKATLSFMLHLVWSFSDREAFPTPGSRAGKPHESSRATAHTAVWQPRGEQLIIYELPNTQSVHAYISKRLYAVSHTWKSSAGDLRQPILPPPASRVRD